MKRINPLSISLALSICVLGCVNSKDINWEIIPITGTVLGTVEYPKQYGPSEIKIRVKLDSEETVLVSSTTKMPIVKGQEVKLYQGTTDSGRKFYVFAHPSQEK
ncbi:hypothetical protein [Pleurocapsa sp. PCC 7319]|uniref:hypothetical protein n=1 Tax=Pleurocapsa sp. PCC 7319 TaxID=118161 RepID=UPI0003828507|nr:hypothetical protein [Pleurocapsa sp. PCC 7319]